MHPHPHPELGCCITLPGHMAPFYVPYPNSRTGNIPGGQVRRICGPGSCFSNAQQNHPMSSSSHQWSISASPGELDNDNRTTDGHTGTSEGIRWTVARISWPSGMVKNQEGCAKVGRPPYHLRNRGVRVDTNKELKVDKRLTNREKSLVRQFARAKAFMVVSSSETRRPGLVVGPFPTLTSP